MFGRGCSNYPPGVTGRMIEEQFADHPCDVCGKMPDDCICPECAVCGDVGNPKCYEISDIHVTPLVRSPEQVESLAAAQAQWEADAKAEAMYWQDQGGEE